MGDSRVRAGCNDPGSVAGLDRYGACQFRRTRHALAGGLVASEISKYRYSACAGRGSVHVSIEGEHAIYIEQRLPGSRIEPLERICLHGTQTGTSVVHWGVERSSTAYSHVELSPRWTAAKVDDMKVIVEDKRNRSVGLVRKAFVKINGGM